MSGAELWWLIAQDAFWSAVVSVGFAVLFNVPRRTLAGCALTGALGHSVRTLLIEWAGLPIEAATLVGATCVGFLALALAKRLRAPSLVFAVSGSIPMVPGLFAFRAILLLLELLGLSTSQPTAQDELLLLVVVDLTRTALILAAIALGIAMPRLLFLRYKPVI
jgi:uncharacterized membrane protein YjjB (DUF3815 family)